MEFKVGVADLDQLPYFKDYLIDSAKETATLHRMLESRGYTDSAENEGLYTGFTLVM